MKTTGDGVKRARALARSQPWDVIVIGAGPAGGAAAQILATSGLRLLVIERHLLPRDKACGGAMPAGNGFVEEDGNGVPLESRCTRVVTLHAGRPLATQARLESPILMARRQDMDLALLSRAIDSAHGSIHLRDGVRVTGLEETSTHVRVRLSDGSIENALHVIGADGAASMAARVPGLRRKAPMGAAIDIEVALDPVRHSRFYQEALFDFYCLPSGYGWIFPKHGYLSCGVIAWQPSGSLRAHAQRFLRTHLPMGQARVVRQSAHPVPGYDGRHPVATDRILLAGDAARLVDPVIGEGIRYAFLSGRLAAEAILRVRGSNPEESHRWGDGRGVGSAGERYQASVAAHVAPLLDPIWRFGVVTFLHAPEIYCRTLRQGAYSKPMPDS